MLLHISKWLFFLIVCRYVLMVAMETKLYCAFSGFHILSSGTCRFNPWSWKWCHVKEQIKVSKTLSLNFEVLTFRSSHACVIFSIYQINDQNKIQYFWPVKKSTITTELTMANQWIWTSLMAKYVSHLEAHTTSLAYHLNRNGQVRANALMFTEFI